MFSQSLVVSTSALDFYSGIWVWTSAVPNFLAWQTKFLSALSGMAPGWLNSNILSLVMTSVWMDWMPNFLAISLLFFCIAFCKDYALVVFRYFLECGVNHFVRATPLSPKIYNDHIIVLNRRLKVFWGQFHCCHSCCSFCEFIWR